MLRSLRSSGIVRGAGIKSNIRPLRKLSTEINVVTEEAAMAQRPVKNSYTTPELYDDKGQGYKSTMVFKNRPAWIAQTRKHWLVAGVDKLGVLTSTLMVVGLCAMGSLSIIGYSEKYQKNPRTFPNKKWQDATVKQKTGRMPIYWETKAVVSDDDDDDDDE